MDDLQQQLVDWAQNAHSAINQQVKEQFNKHYKDADLKDGKIVLKHDVQQGDTPISKQFHYYVQDTRFFKKRKRTIAVVEFSPAGYVVMLPESAIKTIEKPSLVDLTGKKIG